MRTGGTSLTIELRMSLFLDLRIFTQQNWSEYWMAAML